MPAVINIMVNINRYCNIMKQMKKTPAVIIVVNITGTVTFV